MTNIPLNIPLAVPGGPVFLHYLLVLTFIIHIFFIGLMVGGTYWSVLFVVLGRTDPFYKRLAKETLDTVTINKSLAVVLGVAPLLIISLIYTIYWYPAVQMTFPFFLSIIWLVILAFLCLYVYRYLWYSLGERHPLIHFSFGLLAAGIFTVVPFIFLTNINLMLLPFRWDTVNGFFSALILPNVFQRYLHFIVAACAMIGFFAAAYFWYRGRNSDDPFFSRAQQVGLKWALVATLSQGIFGPVNFFSLPTGSYSTGLIVLVLIGIALAATVCVVLIRALQKPSGTVIFSALALVGITAIMMSFVRDTVRVNLLRGPNQIAAHSFEVYQSNLEDFLKTYTPPEEKEGAEKPSGQQLFMRYCSSCHAEDHVLVGPPLTYMVDKYKGSPQAMQTFVLNPVKVNPKLPQMPKPPVTQEQAHEIVEYILSEKWKQPQQQGGGGAQQGTQQPPAQPQEAQSQEAQPQEARPQAQQQEGVQAAEGGPSGKELFDQNCSPCHAFDHVLVGPPEKYMIDKYTGKEQQMVDFVLNPTKVSPGFPEMPKPSVDREQAQKIVEYILSQGEKGSVRQSSEEGGKQKTQ